MIFRLTLKMAKKIGMAPLPVIPYTNIIKPILDWNANLFTVQRIQYILLTNTASLYSMVMFGKGITDDKRFIQEGLSCIKEFMIMDGNQSIYENHFKPENQNTYFSKTIDRRVLGSMNDLIFQSKFYLSEGRRSLFEVSSMLNETPMSYLKYSNPKDQFRKLYFNEDGKSLSNEQTINNVVDINDYRQLKAK